MRGGVKEAAAGDCIGIVINNDGAVKRGDIKVDFIWDILHEKGEKVKALNVPFVVPPYSFGVNFKPVGFGLPTNEKE